MSSSTEQCKNCGVEISLTHIEACGGCGYGRKPTTDEYGKPLPSSQHTPGPQQKEYLTLKWGTLKHWELNSEASLAALQKYNDAGSVSMGCAMQRDNDAQKAAICELIEALNNDEIYLDWDGIYVSKEKAKEYVLNYARNESSLAKAQPPSHE